jgi:hypothetical protein
MNLEKLLAANMIRFGTRNLTVEQAAAAVAAAGSDPAWIKAVQTQLEGIMGTLTMKYKPGTTYTTKYTSGIYAIGSIAKYILPKDSTWKITPSGLFLMTTAKRIVSNNFGYTGPTNMDKDMTGILDGKYCDDIVSGKKMGSDGKPVIFKDIQIVVTPHNQSAKPYPSDTYDSANSAFKFVNTFMGTVLNKLQA